MSTLAEVLPRNQLFMRTENLIEGFANQLQREEICDPAVGEYYNLKLYRKEIPWRRGGYWVLNFRHTRMIISTYKQRAQAHDQKQHTVITRKKKGTPYA